MTGVPRPRVIAIVPARGGSKRIPAKNLLPIAGRPLLAHSLRHAREADAVSETWVSTDDPEIAALAAREGARVVERPADLASDTATSEAALLHVLDARRAQGLDDPDLVVFLQAPTDVLLRRMHTRRRDPESVALQPDDDYLAELNEAYHHFFFHYDATPLLVVETSQFDSDGSDEAIDHLIKQIRSMGPGTRYYVPRTKNV